MVCWLGSSVVIAEFATIMIGTFEVFSWDIMEPISYLMMFSNFTGGWFFYMLMKKDLELTNLHDILTLRFTRKAGIRRGVDFDNHEKVG